MASKAKIRREALNRQGSEMEFRGRQYHIEGNCRVAVFQSGGEGIVHRLVDSSDSQNVLRLKVFFNPTEERRVRTELLVGQRLSSTKGTRADPLVSAPLATIPLTGESRFGVVMREAPGLDWRCLKEQGDCAPKWPQMEQRISMAYGLVTAVERLERARLAHADLSPGNVVVVPDGNECGTVSLVDFDSFVSLDGGTTTLRDHRGSPGYAAPEVWTGGTVTLGTDRFTLAILIQEMLLCGDSGLDRSSRFGCFYDQDALIGGHELPHPEFRCRYKNLAALLGRALTARPEARPAPAEWRTHLRNEWDQGRGGANRPTGGLLGYALKRMKNIYAPQVQADASYSR
jgi:serine/threonine protein kinase